MAPLLTVPVTVKRVLRPGARKFRYATRRRRILPSILIIGAQRAGTTSLFEHLQAHPDFAGPRSADASIDWPKEIHFFDENFEKGLDWYRAFFPLESTRGRRRKRGGDLVAGEATPYYMFDPAVPARVAATLPDVRLVAILRDPVRRAYSHYQMMRWKGREKLSFEEAIEAEPKRLAGVEEWLSSESELPRHPNYHHHRHRAYVSRGYYAEQLERWLEHFPHEQLLVLRAEDMLAHMQKTYDEVLRFVGLRDWTLTDLEPRNRQPYSPIDPDTSRRLEELFAEPNAQLTDLLGWPEAWGVPARTAESVTRTFARKDAD